jgi:hypothetical protein
VVWKLCLHAMNRVFRSPHRGRAAEYRQVRGIKEIESLATGYTPVP